MRKLKAFALVLAVVACVLTWQNAQGRAQDREVQGLSRRISAVEQRTRYMQARLCLEDQADAGPYGL